MFSTSMLAVVSGFVLAAAPSTPTFLADYPQALRLAGEQHKSVAVFIAASPAAGLSAEAAQALRQNFICLHVDTTTPAGKDLAQSFQLPEGLVISDRTGGVQALRHGGKVEPADLARYVQQYAAADAPATTNLANGAAPVAASIQPVSYAAPVYAPQYAPSYPSFGGGCAGGNCGASYPVMRSGCAGGRCR